MNRARANVFVLLLATLAPPTIASGDVIGHEAPDIEIISATVGGSGCPDESARVGLSDDKRKLIVWLDDHRATPDTYSSCNVAVQLRIPEDVKIALKDLDYRGYARIPDLSGREARLRAEYFFAGGEGPIQTHTFPRGYEGSYKIWPDDHGEVWTSCGDAGAIARVNTGIEVWGPDPLVTIDKITLELDWEYC